MDLSEGPQRGRRQCRAAQATARVRQARHNRDLRQQATRGWRVSAHAFSRGVCPLCLYNEQEDTILDNLCMRHRIVLLEEAPPIRFILAIKFAGSGVPAVEQLVSLPAELTVNTGKIIAGVFRGITRVRVKHFGRSTSRWL